MSVRESSLYGRATGRVFAVTCFVATVAACGEIGETGTSETLSKESPLFFEPLEDVTLWNGATLSNPGPLGTGVLIPICFSVRPHIEPSGTVKCPFQTSASVDCSGNTMDLRRGVSLDVPLVRQKIRTAIERTWVRYADVSFTGWGDCPFDPTLGTNGMTRESDLPATIMIAIQQHFIPPENQTCTTHEHCSNTTNAYCNNGFCEAGAVDITNTWGRSTTTARVVQLSWSYLIQPEPGTAGLRALLHEMGHALGFHHEWRRSDFSDPNCTDPDPAPDGIFLSAFPDPDSILACRRPDDGTISPGDILGVQRAYGRKSTGSLVGFGGMCANILGGFTAIGTPIIAFPCNNTFNDRWFRESTSQHFRANMGPVIQRCLNVSGGVVNPNGPTPVISWVCDSGTNEDFPLSFVEWRGMGSMCATAPTFPSNTITMKPCDGSFNQKWSFMMRHPNPIMSPQFGQIRSARGSCVRTATAGGAVGQQLTLAPCSVSDARQFFSYPGQGIIAHGNFCVNVSGGLPNPGSALILWDGCMNTPRPYNEQFTLVGNMMSLGQCLDATNRSQVSVAPCSSTNVDQIWEYFL